METEKERYAEMSPARGSRELEKGKDAGHKGLVPTVGGVVGLLIAAPLIFYLILPYFDLLLRPLVGNWVDLFRLLAFPWDYVVGVCLVLVGFFYALWAFLALYRIGKGSAVPFLPTRVLVVVGPYRYSRNPMVLGVIILYTGVGILLHSMAMVVVVLAVIVFPYILYIKFIEEKGLVTRFGEAYLKYKSKTRFIVPLARRHRKT